MINDSLLHQRFSSGSGTHACRSAQASAVSASRNTTVSWRGSDSGRATMSLANVALSSGSASRKPYGQRNVRAEGMSCGLEEKKKTRERRTAHLKVHFILDHKLDQWLDIALAELRKQ